MLFSSIFFFNSKNVFKSLLSWGCSCGKGLSHKYLSNLPLCDATVDTLTNDKILPFLSKLTAFADGKIYVTERVKFVVERVENIVGKGGNDDYQHFLLFAIMFSRLLSQRLFKFGIVW